MPRFTYHEELDHAIKDRWLYTPLRDGWVRARGGPDFLGRIDVVQAGLNIWPGATDPFDHLLEEVFQNLKAPPVRMVDCVTFDEGEG